MKTDLVKKYLTTRDEKSSDIEELPPKINSVKQILETLNEGLDEPVWMEATGVYKLAQSKIIDKKVSESGASAVIKTFINFETAEIRFYLAKFLSDVPEVKDLP